MLLGRMQLKVPIEALCYWGMAVEVAKRIVEVGCRGRY